MDKEKQEVEFKEVPQQKMSYDDLENVAIQLSDQVQQLKEKLYHSDMQGILRRLTFLIEILKLSKEDIFPDEYIESTAKEVMELMELREEEEK